MNLEKVETATRELWENAKTIYISSLRSSNAQQQAERNLDMINNIVREGNTLNLYTTTKFVADTIRDEYSEKLKGAFMIVGEPNIEIKVLVNAVEKPTLMVPINSTTHPTMSKRVGSTFISTIPLNGDYTFEEFVSGPCNSFAIAAAKAVVKNPGRGGYNPLFIHGGTGLGKTHLMQAIGNQLKKDDPSLAICYLTAEEYLNEYVNYMKEGNIPKFREKYRSLDVLLIDDVQFFQKGKEIQEEFFNTFNALKDKKKQIVMTSDVAPKNLPSSIEVRLISRFEGGMLQEIESPNYETRFAILKKKTENMSVRIPDFALEYIADNIKSHVRAMEGALATVEVFISANPNVILDKDMLAKILGDFIKKEVTMRMITIEEIQQSCAKKFGITMAEIISHEKTQSLVTPRQMAMFIARKYTSKGLKEIADAFGKKHATILHGVKTIQQRIENEKDLKSNLEELLADFGYKLSDAND